MNFNKQSFKYPKSILLVSNWIQMGKTNNPVNVKFTNEQKKIIDRIIGVMGGSDAEVIRNIFLAWLSEKDILQNYINNKGGTN